MLKTREQMISIALDSFVKIQLSLSNTVYVIYRQLIHIHTKYIHNLLHKTPANWLLLLHFNYKHQQQVQHSNLAISIVSLCSK